MQIYNYVVIYDKLKIANIEINMVKSFVRLENKF